MRITFPIPRTDDDRHALVAPDRPRLSEVLVGEDLLQIDRLWQLLYRASYHYGVASWAKQVGDRVERARCGRRGSGRRGDRLPRDGRLMALDIELVNVSPMPAAIARRLQTIKRETPRFAVLAARKVEKRPLWQDGGFVPTSMLTVTLSSDHRALDGADAARFLGTLRQLLEAPARLAGSSR
jgi:hypothetical protein